MNISLTTIILLALLLVLAIAVPFFSPYFRGRRLLKYSKDSVVPEDNGEEKQSTDEDVTEDKQGISVVIVEHDSAYRLSQVLPSFLSQDYEGDYQVIVVIDQNDSESEDVLKRHSDNPHLYYTMLPVTSRYLSRKKLGITIGMRAAKYDWVVVTDVHSRPENKKWLSSIASHCTADRNLVLGTTLYDDEASTYYRVDQLRVMLYHFSQAQKGVPYSTNQSVLALRKEEFFRERGFSGNLEYTRSEMEFLVNKHGRENACEIAIEPDARLKQFKPNKERWKARQLATLNSREAMKRRKQYSFRYHLDAFLMHLQNIMTIGVMALGVVGILSDEADISVENIMLLAIAPVLWIISNIMRILLYRPVINAFTNISPIRVIIQEWFIVWHDFAHRIRYRFADKNDFITHKL